jgi:hypothetical protein
MTPDHVSPFVPTPLRRDSTYGAIPELSPDSVTLPAEFAPCEPHCDPQKMR